MKRLRTGDPHKATRFYDLALTSNIAGTETNIVKMLRVIVAQDHEELGTKDPVPDSNSHSLDAGADQTPITPTLLNRLGPKDPKPPPLTPIPDGEPNNHFLDAGADQTPTIPVLLNRLGPKDPKPPPLTPIPDGEPNSHSLDAGVNQTPITPMLLKRLDPNNPKPPPPLTPIPDGEPNSHRHGQISITHHPHTLPAPSCLQSIPTVAPYVICHFGLF